jgi:hypothetical protein
MDRFIWVRQEVSSEWEPASINADCDYVMLIGESDVTEVAVLAEIGAEIIAPPLYTPDYYRRGGVTVID